MTPSRLARVRRAADGPGVTDEQVDDLLAEVDRLRDELQEANVMAVGAAMVLQDTIKERDALREAMEWIKDPVDTMLTGTVLDCPPPWPQLDRPDIAALCEQDGFGFVMQVASYLWQCRDAYGAHTTGPALGTVQEMQRRLERALVGVVPPDAHPFDS
jgi:hypothetical protein